MKNVLVTGGNGYIAKELHNSLSTVYNITPITRLDVDLCDTDSVNKWFSDKQFDTVIHTAIRGGSRLVQDNADVLDSNLRMYYNLLNNRHHYDRFINIGSGAELYGSHTPYGLSKNVIRNSLIEKDNFYNIRIFAVFGENEIDTRFIKSNIIRYIRKEPLHIHQDKLMDFFYMGDFIEVIKHYIDQDSLPKEFDCSYERHYLLSDIAEMINTLSDYKVAVTTFNLQSAENYIGRYTPLDISTSGLHTGIINVYNKLLCKI